MALHPEHVFVIPCKKCGTKIEFVAPKALNSEIDVYEKYELLNGTLFNCVCRKCGEKTVLNFEIIYHDVKHNTAIYKVDEDMVDGVRIALELIDQMMTKVGNSQELPRYRIVTCAEKLKEKALIFDSGFDDRVIELVKRRCIAEAKKKIRNLYPRATFFDIRDGQYVLDIHCRDEIVSAVIPDELYEQIQEEFSEILQNDDVYLIDEQWAINAIEVKAESDDFF